MDQHLYSDLGLCPAGSTVEVELRGAEAFVRLVNADNYDALCAGEAFDYAAGCVWETSPVILDVPADDHWYVVIHGYEGPITLQAATIYDN